MINKERLIKTFCDLVQIDSPSGEEENVALFLIDFLENLGLKTQRDSYGNLIAKSSGKPQIILSGHMDTVEPGRGIKPQIQQDKIVSDGTTILGGDAKAGVSAILEGLQSIFEDHHQIPPVEVVFTREEEIGLVGAENLDFSLISAKEAIVFDGEGPASTMTISSPTYMGFIIEITGRSAHAGVEPEKGLSAIRIAADLITKLPQGRLDKNTTFNIGLIEGGSTRNTVADSTTITGEFRSTNIEKLDEIQSEITEIVQSIKTKYPEANLNTHLHKQFETYTISEDDPVRRRVNESLNSLGLTPNYVESGGGTDGNVFKLNNIDAVVIGMAVTGMHTKREFVTIPDLVDTAHLCEALLRKEIV
tara:strand:+ start:3331 stop:4416 length:1086 start_codon:yes stop_codon:yes gene_type:complete